MNNERPTYNERIDYLREQIRKNIANGNLQEVMLINLHEVEKYIYVTKSHMELMRFNENDRDRITAITIIELIEELIKESKESISFTSAYSLIDEIKDQYGIERDKEDD